MTLQTTSSSRVGTTWKDAPNRGVDISGAMLAYRSLGARTGVPLVMVNHWGAVLDNFDPRIVDGLAAGRPVIALDYRGVGLSSGQAPLTVAEMAKDVIEAIRALGLKQVDLLGFSLGGFVAQEVTLGAPDLIRKLILTGTGPAGGKGISDVGRVSLPLIGKAMLTFRDPKYYLFFSSSKASRKAADAFIARLKERKNDRDAPITMAASQRQLKAIQAWGKQTPQDLGAIKIPVFVANGDNDAMVPTVHSADLAKRLPHAELVIYEDAGHGGIFQHHERFLRDALAFLDA